MSSLFSFSVTQYCISLTALISLNLLLQIGEKTFWKNVWFGRVGLYKEKQSKHSSQRLCRKLTNKCKGTTRRVKRKMFQSKRVERVSFSL